jgi:hypothetical protein
MRQALQVTGIVAAHFKDAQFLTFPLNGTVQVLADLQAFYANMGAEPGPVMPEVQAYSSTIVAV